MMNFRLQFFSLHFYYCYISTENCRDAFDFKANINVYLIRKKRRKEQFSNFLSFILFVFYFYCFRKHFKIYKTTIKQHMINKHRLHNDLSQLLTFDRILLPSFICSLFIGILTFSKNIYFLFCFSVSWLFTLRKFTTQKFTFQSFFFILIIFLFSFWFTLLGLCWK